MSTASWSGLGRPFASAVLGTWVIGTIQATGRSAETAVDLVSDLFSTWLATRTALQRAVS
jgi:hypothetical protein